MSKPGSAFEALVADVAKAFDSKASVNWGQWVDGPDGRRDMDVIITGRVSFSDVTLLIECKDYDAKKTGKVGIEVVDALDSKLNDLSINKAIICSNSGFTESALAKAKRRDIGLISILKFGDQKIKAEIKDEIFFRKIWLRDIDLKFNGQLEGLQEKQLRQNIHDLKYLGQPLINWLQIKASNVASRNPFVTQKIRASFKFKQNTTFSFRDKAIMLSEVIISFRPETKWYSQIVSLDASLGIYDYLRKQVKLAGETGQYFVKGINWDNAKEIESPPKNWELIFGMQNDEFYIFFAVTEGLDYGNQGFPDLDPLIVPEDLNLIIKNQV